MQYPTLTSAVIILSTSKVHMAVVLELLAAGSYKWPDVHTKFHKNLTISS
jgi:hypothetical protein